MTDEALKQIESQVKELDNVVKLTEDTIGLIAGSDIPGKYCKVVLNVLEYHEEFLKRVKGQRDSLKAQLPKPAETPAIEAVGSPVAAPESAA